MMRFGAINVLVAPAGLEPAPAHHRVDFESTASTIPPGGHFLDYLEPAESARKKYTTGQRPLHFFFLPTLRRNGAPDTS